MKYWNFNVKIVLFAFILFMLLLLTDSCTTSKLLNKNKAHTEQENDVIDHSLIIYYDGKEGKQSLLEVLKKMNAEVIYDLKNMPVLTARIPNKLNADKAIKRLMQTKGVLQVNKDKKIKLH